MVLTLAACGVPKPTHPDDPAARMYYPVDLPWARDSEPDVFTWSAAADGSKVPPIVMNVTRTDWLYFKSWEFAVGPGDYRSENVEALEEALTNIRRYGWPPDVSAPWVLINAEVDASWGAVRDAMASVAIPSFAAERMHVACRSPHRPGERRMVFRVRRGEAEEDAADLVLAEPLSMSRDPSERPPEDWAPTLPAALPKGADAVRLTSPEDLRWWQLVEALDALRAAGVTSIALPQAGVVVEPLPHEKDPAWDATPTPPLRLPGTIALVGLCFAAGWIAWRGRRRV